MKTPRRSLIGKYLGLIALAAIAVASAAAQEDPSKYPTRPIHIIVGFTAGGGNDIIARIFGQKLSESLGQPVIIENKPGGGAIVATEYVAKSAPDGYTLLVNSPAVAINMALYKDLPYDTLRDFAAVSIFSESPNILVVNVSSPAKSVNELIALARSKPGVLNYSSAGTGTTQNLAGELFKLRTGTNIVHVPYKGTAPSLTALIAGDVDLTFANVPAIIQHVKSGRLRPLASTGARRSELMPDVPTMQEAGSKGVEVTVWYAVLAPAATPRDIINTLSEATIKATRSPDIRQRLLDQGAEPVGSTSAEFDKVLREEVAKWTDVIRASGIRAE